MLQGPQSCEACVFSLDLHFSWQDHISNRWDYGSQWSTAFLECRLCICEENDWRDEQVLQRGIRMQLHINYSHEHLRSSWQLQVRIVFFYYLAKYKTTGLNRYFVMTLVLRMVTSFLALSTKLTWPKRMVRKDNFLCVCLRSTLHFHNSTQISIHCYDICLILLLPFANTDVTYTFYSRLCVASAIHVCIKICQTTNMMSIYI